eukprot:453055-Lingulodinium_polyedra.AAC.1
MLGFKIGIHAGAIVFAKLHPDHVDGILNATGANRWIREVNPPIRLCATTGTPPGPPWHQATRGPGFGHNSVAT